MATLVYARCAKRIKNEVRINKDPKNTLLRQFKEEIDNLRKRLSDGMGSAVMEGETMIIEKIIRI
jgi:hypothetical protein